MPPATLPPPCATTKKKQHVYFSIEKSFIQNFCFRKLYFKTYLKNQYFLKLYLKCTALGGMNVFVNINK